MADEGALFTSERDGQAYVLRYSPDAKRSRIDGVVGYEKTGVDGYRVVCFGFGELVALDDASFEMRVQPE